MHREKIKEILKSLEIEVLNEIQNGLEISVPAYRADVTREIDVIEEILRIYGYNKIDSLQKISFTPVKLSLDDQDALENSWARTLQSNGFNEVMNNSLTSVKDETDAVKLLNPLSGDLAVMRQSLLPGLLENSAYNLNRRISDIRLFEFGKIYSKSIENYIENERLAILISGNKNAENWTNPVQKTNFFTLKGIVYQILERLNIQNINEKPLQSNVFPEMLSLELNGKNLGQIGIVDKNILKKYEVSQAVFYADLDWRLLAQIATEQNLKYREISKFPAVRRDLALLIDESILYFELFELAQKLKLDLLKSVQLFDVYEGDKLPAGKKSYAMSFVLQDEGKTLSDAEIENTMNELIRNFQKNFNAELRN